MSYQFLTRYIALQLPEFARKPLRLLTKKGRLVRKVKARKNARAASPYIYTDSPTVSLIIQSFNHRDNIERIVDRLRGTVADELIVCEDGSVDGSEKIWRQQLTRPNDFLIQSNDLHEIRTYNRAISLARGDFVGVLQDDDIPPENPSWVTNAVALFRKYPTLAVLGGWNAWTFDVDNEVLGRPVGPGWLDDSYRISLMEPELMLPFRFVGAVGIGPMFFRRIDFEALGGFDLRLSRPGEPGIWLDFDICLRAWLSGRHVGVYETERFERHIGGQGVMMFAGSKLPANWTRNRDYIQGTYADRFGAIRRLVDDLNQSLAHRPNGTDNTKL